MSKTAWTSNPTYAASATDTWDNATDTWDNVLETWDCGNPSLLLPEETKWTVQTP